MERIVGTVENELGCRRVEPFGEATAGFVRNLRLDPLAVQERELVVSLGECLVLVDKELDNPTQEVFAVRSVRVEGFENEAVIFGGLVPDALRRYCQDLSVCGELLRNLD